MKAPQIIWICMILLNLVLAGYLHDKPKEGKHSLGTTILGTIISGGLLYWGGFFS